MLHAVLFKTIFQLKTNVLSRLCLFSWSSKFESSLKVKATSVWYRFKSSNMNRIVMPSQPLLVLDNITKSCEDKRLYRGLQLSNGMKVVLITDSNTEKSAAALDVNVGSMCDPDGLPGLAHFCEHMLFLGTEKYPVENEYNKFLSEHGGSSNASTGSDHTQYYFDILPEHLNGALDRFAQFFIGPLFTESATLREVKAVHSEHEKNLASDDWRLSQLEKFLSKEDHPYRKFGTGSAETLYDGPKAKGIDVRKRLLDFHAEWYSSNIMTLVVLGRESLDELEEVITKLFSKVVNKKVKPPVWLDHPVGPEQVKVQTLVVPIEDIRSLVISFPIPDFHEHYKAAPCRYLEHLVGHEGPGSILSALKDRGWCNNLCSGERSGAKGFSLFTVVMDLTVDGLLHVNEIVTLVFQYLNMLREIGPQEWIFSECQQIKNVGFRFKDKETPYKYVSALSSRMHLYPLDEVLIGPYLMSEWRPDLINMVLDLLVPSRARIAVISRKYETVADSKEPWYGTKYKEEVIDKAVLKDWENCGVTSELSCFSRNVFIPENLDLMPTEEKASKHPAIIYSTDYARLWFKQDDVFLLPKATVKFEIASPIASLDPLNRCLLYMFTVLLKDSLTEYGYDAALAGLGWDASGSRSGVRLEVSGYNDKLKILFDKIVDKMTNFTVDEKRFEVLKEAYVRDLQNFALKPPYKQAAYYLTALLLEQSWTIDQLLSCTDLITVDALVEFVPFLLRRVHVEGLIYGNVSRQGAMDIMNSLETKLACNECTFPLMPQQLLLLREVQLTDGSHFVYEARNEVHKSSSTETYFQCGLESTQANMELELLAQLINEPCFNVLRTEEQLGYIVWSGVRRSSGVQGLRFRIQSDKHPKYLIQRIEAFLVQVRTLLVEMPSDEFERHREFLAQLILEKPKKLSQQSQIYWSEISTKQYHFNRSEVEAAYLRTISKDQVLELYDKYVAPDAPCRHRLSIFVISDAAGGAGTLPEDYVEETPPGRIPPPPMVPPQVIDDVISFKSSQGLHPLPSPYIDFNQTKSKL